MIDLANPDFNKSAYLKRLESINYLMLMLPMAFFGWVFLEKEFQGDLKTSFWDNPDLIFHGAMLIGIFYVFSRTLVSWKSTALKVLKKVKPLDEKLEKLRKPFTWRSMLWTIGAGISTYGLYVKGDMFYVIFFTIFLVLITANRPTGLYFSKFLKLKDEEKKWMEQK